MYGTRSEGLTRSRPVLGNRQAVDCAAAVEASCSERSRPMAGKRGGGFQQPDRSRESVRSTRRRSTVARRDRLMITFGSEQLNTDVPSRGLKCLQACTAYRMDRVKGYLCCKEFQSGKNGFLGGMADAAQGPDRTPAIPYQTVLRNGICSL
jgi:hypothetical protein